MLGAMGPAWTRGEIEAPAGEKDMGDWYSAVYTREQQSRLGVAESGEPLNTAGPRAGHREEFTVVSDGGLRSDAPEFSVGHSHTGYREEFTVVRDGGRAVAPAPAPARYNRVEAAKAAKARKRWRVAGTMAKTVVALPMAIGIPVRPDQVPRDAVWASAVDVPMAVGIDMSTGELQMTDADKMALLRTKLASVPPEAFATLDTNRDGFLDAEELRRGFEVCDLNLSSFVSLHMRRHVFTNLPFFSYPGSFRLNVAAQALGQQLTDPELATITAMADTDRDGKVSVAEFELLASTLAEVAALKRELGVE